jgi:hypothetical protein
MGMLAVGVEMIVDYFSIVMTTPKKWLCTIGAMINTCVVPGRLGFTYCELA